MTETKNYVAPACHLVHVEAEGVLCSSTGYGSTNKIYDWVYDTDENVPEI